MNIFDGLSCIVTIHLGLEMTRYRLAAQPDEVNYFGYASCWLFFGIGGRIDSPNFRNSLQQGQNNGIVSLDETLGPCSIVG